MTTKSPPEKASYHHGDLRKVLLDEAARIIREEGEAALSMRKLAAGTGVSRSAPYHHFKDKQALLCSVAEEGFRQFVESVKALPQGDDEPVTKSHIAQFVQNYVHFAANHPEYYDLMFGSHLWKSGTLTDTLTREAHKSFRGYVETVRNWQTNGRIVSSVDPLRYAQVSWSTLHGMSRFLIDGIYVDRAALEAMCDNATDMFWRQLTTA
jgi:AcrR family transcriptional regulator